CARDGGGFGLLDYW
nr:immunoglobulin heavy chain junction region [Macaca mulatta]